MVTDLSKFQYLISPPRHHREVRGHPERFPLMLGAKSLKSIFSHVHKSALRKKVEPKQLHPGAVLENGATLEGGAIFFLNNHEHCVRKSRRFFISSVAMMLTKHNGSTINDLGGSEEKSKMNLFFPRECLLKFIFSWRRPLEICFFLEMKFIFSWVRSFEIYFFLGKAS